MSGVKQPLAARLMCFAAVAAFSSAACDRPPSADSLPEWTPGDHHSIDDDKLAAAGQAPRVNRKDEGAQDDVPQLVDLAWRQQCATCHGVGGRGDGPTGPMVRAPDLTDADLQRRMTDDDLAAVIRNGKNKMPRFDLPDAVVRGLVARIRSLAERR